MPSLQSFTTDLRTLRKNGSPQLFVSLASFLDSFTSPLVNRLWVTLYNYEETLIVNRFVGGQWMLDLVDTFGAGFVIFIVALLEMVGFIWVYGLNNVVRDIEFMLNMKIGLYWKFCWGIFIPFSLTIIFIHSTIGRLSSPLQYNGVDFPEGAVGWFLLIQYSESH